MRGGGGHFVSSRVSRVSVSVCPPRRSRREFAAFNPPRGQGSGSAPRHPHPHHVPVFTRIYVSIWPGARPPPIEGRRASTPPQHPGLGLESDRSRLLLVICCS